MSAFRIPLFLLALLATLPFPGSATAADDRPNVLFIAIDDLRPELGCYGVEHVHSPQIDELAASGLTFDRAYCQLAVCNPSRVSLLTGLRPDSAHVWTLDVRFRETVPDATTLPQYFKAQGYRTLGYGKIFHNPWPDNVSWSEPHAWPRDARLWSDEAKAELADFKRSLREEGKPEALIARLRARATEIVDLDDSEHTDGAIADQAVDALRRLSAGDRPFFLAAGFVRPHLPFVVPRKYWELYDRATLPLGEGTAPPEGAPAWAMNTMYELRDYFDYLDTPPPTGGSLTEVQRRELTHGYLASVSFIDAQVGKLLDELDRLGLADDTIVVLWSDHGWKLGEHNSWCKQTNYEVDTRVPLIIRAPGVSAPGRHSRSLVELVDLYPTLCELAGLPLPQGLEGVSLKPVLETPESKVKEGAASQFLRHDGDRELMGYAWRNDRWRYVEWIDWKDGTIVDRELYDHDTDPGETRNLAREKGRDELMEQLGKHMREHLPGRPVGHPIRPETSSGSAPAGTRPVLILRNGGDATVTVSWLPAEGEPRVVGRIEPGESLTQNTTLGHRFRVQGNGMNRIVTVTRKRETVVVGGSTDKATTGPASALPNIVVIMGDDWSWPHASILGDLTVETPTFDRIAREGLLVENAFVAAPSCTPSRLAVASGQHPWRLGPGADLGGSIAADVPVYADLLAGAGYLTGFSRKGAEPSRHEYRGNDPFGSRFENFETFLAGRKPGQPFCFWYGAGEPHRPYDWEASRESDLDLAGIEVPPYLPDNDVVRTDLGDYYLRVEKLDRLAGGILARLEETGELENTIIVMTGDNGMPFPRAKATLYDSGTRVPLAIRWGSMVEVGRRIEDFVGLVDLAPTFLEAAGLPVPGSMTGRSLLPLLRSEIRSGRIDPERDAVLAGMERHVQPNPSRAIRTKDFLYLRNFAPESWPTGAPGDGKVLTFDFRETPWPTVPGAFSHNIDPGPTKQWMRLHDSPQDGRVFDRRPAEELYDLRNDPHQLTNLLTGKTIDEATAKTRRELSDRLTRELRGSGDPRFHLDSHATFSVRGWTLHLSDRLWEEEANATRRMLELLDGQLSRVSEAVPEQALSRLREIPIWINPPYPGRRGTAEYHPDRGWLEENGREPAMARAVEITNVREFPFENRRMPYLLLHELAHGFHDRVLEGGYGNTEVRAAFERARDSGGYDEVDRFDGNRIRKDKAYALSNPMEYFAESSEAYFGKNDFYPFNREELRDHDPRMLDLLEQLWRLPPGH